MAEIVKVEDASRYDVAQYERLFGQLPHFRMRGEELMAKIVRHGTLYAIDDGGKLLGHAGFYANDMEKKAAYFSSMAVDSSLRGRGWGDRLMDRVFEDCRRVGMKDVMATVVKTNALAIEMYKRRGCRFTECEGDPSRFSIAFPMDYPRLSVVCLAYNAAPYIRQALDGRHGGHNPRIRREVPGHNPPRVPEGKPVFEGSRRVLGFPVAAHSREVCRDVRG